MNTKQVIVYRTSYTHSDGTKFKLRTGKIAAQISHCSMAFLTRRMKLSEIENRFIIDLTQPEAEWLKSSFAKIVLQVETEEQLLDIYQKAKEAGLEVHLIEDSGKTEFNGIPTKTCLAIGPDESEKIDKITGHLSLF